ncbi:LytR/AlgR family response regulator transcription factor [Flaviaesturariibacter aridisoli]|uniref:Response regulator transcription factor n=1 Tax=Flaviaesturariibacter aridisoli TaxID=2545761 RepID=A0A4R4EA46_9BACT|nr:LytTR family DNA-binding domain-containing protein [Flaviaesturariibacter aridisoli]RYY63169.1 MAG: response regulator transcription factor [Chitinophagaceae bacterium]TCZ74971.1 response regulator transcription factor [Flaviaesturariibacter aridisoli]
MKCIIVDDNKMARMAMKQLVGQVKDLDLVAECEDAMEAYNIINKQPIDLIFLDIEMPGMTGLELTKNLGHKSPLIIFTTAKTDYAVEAFELNVVDYLVKPIQPGRFLQAVERAQETLASDKEEVKVEAQEFVFVKDNGILKRINVEEILYLEAMGDYVKVHTPAKFHVLHATLKSIEEKLSPQKFIRVHRSYIVSLSKIDFIQEGVISIGKASVPVADTYRTALNKRLNLL